ncbi:MAG: hypothetical protein Q9173_003360 [Seirophora scorigena]
MTFSPPAGETSDTASQCMDLEPPWHDVIWGSGSGCHVAQGDLSKSVGAGSGVEAQPSTSSGKTKVPLAEQGIAFQNALQQESLCRLMGTDSGVEAQPSTSTSSRKMHVPLADQGIAFQHALQRCTGALSGLRGAQFPRAEQGGVVAAASRRHSKTREQKAAKKRRQREREGKRQGADMGQTG